MQNGDIDWGEARDRIIGLGETSSRKTYYAELQKRIEELHASEADLRTILNSTHDAIIIHDLEGRIEVVNEAMLRLYRVTREQAVSYSISHYTAQGPLQDRIPVIFERLKTDTTDPVFEWMARRPVDGTEFPVEVALRTSIWKGRRMVVAVVRDISERHQAEQERKRLEAQLAQSRKMELVGQLAGGIAHDFNNMLTPILSYATLLRDDFPQGDPRRSDLEEIVRSALRARDLTRQLLAFARKQQLVLKRLDLNQTIRGFQRMLARTLRENIRIETRLQDSVEAIDGDNGQIEQILLNLAINAQDAMPEGGSFILATESVELPESRGLIPAGRYVRLSAIDAGIGMDADTKARIFEPFFTTKGQGRGTGLGLATVYGIVRQHGAHIELESEPGRGTRFDILFPAQLHLGDGQAALPAQAWEHSARGVILLVEDQDAVRQSTQAMLERIGYTVLSANNGAQAIDLAERHVGQISLLVTDVIMEGLDGRQLYERLARRHASLRVLYMSGYPADVISRHGVLDKNTHFLPKPFTPQEMIPAIVRALGDERRAEG